jgi:mono/diheme cytochrome c family protein
MNQAASDKLLPAATGVAVGVMIFAGLSLWFGRAMIPTVEQLPTYPQPVKPDPYAPAGAAVAAAPVDAGEQVYVSVCGSCHQANGQGLAGAFPPLAGSSWVTGDVETPIRIMILGLSGPIEVNGQQYNSLMPPPPGVSGDDEKIALALTYVRSAFGNQAGAVDKSKVAAVRASLAGRSTAWTAQELLALRPGAGAAPAVAPPTPAPPTQP